MSTAEPYEFRFEGKRFRIAPDSDSRVEIWLEADGEDEEGWACATPREQARALCHELRRLVAQLPETRTKENA